MVKIAISAFCKKLLVTSFELFVVCFSFKELLTEINSEENTLSARAEQVSGKLNEIEREEFESRLENLNEEWHTAKQKLTEQREFLTSGISSCMKQLEVMEQANQAANEVDQLLSELDNTAKEDDMDSMERKAEVSSYHFFTTLTLFRVLFNTLCLVCAECVLMNWQPTKRGQFASLDVLHEIN